MNSRPSHKYSDCAGDTAAYTGRSAHVDQDTKIG